MKSVRDVSAILDSFADRSLTIRVDGPPRYDSRRVIVEGDAGAFRMFAETLLAMAETVEADPAIRQTGWRLVLGPEEVPQLHMVNADHLVLDCDPVYQDAP